MYRSKKTEDKNSSFPIGALNVLVVECEDMISESSWSDNSTRTDGLYSMMIEPTKFYRIFEISVKFS